MLFRSNNFVGTLKKIKVLGQGGTTVNVEEFEIGDTLKHKYSNDNYQLMSLSNNGYTVAKIVNGKKVEYNSFPVNINDHNLFHKA